ncbi:uncharacterized protein LOC132066015 [Lycium ferocissimum]|uniref:uncharacterized protein LOC132066015 n=1 Tax=Lycium ferocissimum TaxID=112874 RepID=UPI002814A9AA|nr:uncharacterized protein LOC132066015 [Lycium ferocissimum]
MCSLSIQKDIVDSCAKETIKAIIEDLDGDYFGILVYESKDISHREQMTLILRYVNKEGEVVERFVGIVHGSDTSARLLKVAIYSFLSDHSLSPSQIRGQDYDGASNMQGELNGEVHSGRGLNQERGLQRPGDTHWDSHYRSLDNLIVLFPSIIHVLEFTGHECPNYTDRLVAKSLDGSIAIAMGLLALTKQRLQNMKDSEFRLLTDDVSSFCDKYDTMILKMETFLEKLKNHFDAVSTDLFLGMASLNPVNSFGNFDKNRIMRLAECNTNEFDSNKVRDLSCQLDSFIVYARGSDRRFFNLKGISDLAKLLVKSDLHQTWPLVYLLIKLTFILPVATPSVE